ncbi:ATP-binding protein [Vibrio sinensis]|uniref:ATP-binding protein n=1 Tax=Vibrio sinensis TaxID=2302434 RepID=A0A3A6QVP1_9VIBR|nr:ATP-binding protein [Vibrio sinensis]RJX72897.1 ATP-binding protein [Vibrio sinensis]
MTFKLTLIRGLPGSGKSTLAKALAMDGVNTIHLEADMYFVNSQGEYHFDPSQLPNAHQWCQQQTEQGLRSKQNVVVSNTFVRRWEIVPYWRLAKQYRAQFEIIECQGDYGNIHGVDASVITTMKKRWQTWQNDRQ